MLTNGPLQGLLPALYTPIPKLHIAPFSFKTSCFPSKKRQLRSAAFS